MKALAKLKKEPGLDLIEAPLPEAHDGDVLIKITKTSICGTDLHIWKWDSWAEKTVATPLIIGHEFMGEVAYIGKNVEGLKIGDRVSGEGHITCGHCPNCRKGKKHICLHTIGIGVKTAGCFAEYIALPEENVFILPDSISDDMGAIFDPFGNAVHTALSFEMAGEDVLITGAGPIGIMAAAIARHAGARHVVITDVNDYRLSLALKMGATTAINIKKESLKEKTAALGVKCGYTVGLEMSGNNEALCSMLELIQPGGHVALLGILPPKTSIDWDLVIFKMLTLKGIYGREILGTWYKMTHLLESGLNLSPIITHHFNFLDYKQAFETVKIGNCGKIILNLSS